MNARWSCEDGTYGSLRKLDVCATLVVIIWIYRPAGRGLVESGKGWVDVEGVWRVREYGNKVGEDDDGGADEEEPLEGGGWGHGGEEGGQVERGGAHARMQQEGVLELRRRESAQTPAADTTLSCPGATRLFSRQSRTFGQEATWGEDSRHVWGSREALFVRCLAVVVARPLSLCAAVPPPSAPLSLQGRDVPCTPCLIQMPPLSLWTTSCTPCLLPPLLNLSPQTRLRPPSPNRCSHPLQIV